jgi:hypothetical protein
MRTWPRPSACTPRSAAWIYRRCSMVVFGGSGPVHGARIARKLRVPRVICPFGAGVMSAFGLLASPGRFRAGAVASHVGLHATHDGRMRFAETA